MAMALAFDGRRAPRQTCRHDPQETPDAPAMSSRTPSSTRSSNRRNAILDAATEIFATRGYDGASVREISERVGITKGNLTYHFAVKEDLLFVILNDVHDDFLSMAQGWPNLEGEDSDDILRTAFRQHALRVATHLDATRLMYEAFRHLSADQRAVLLQKRSGYERAARTLIARCRPELGSPNSRDMKLRTRTVLGMLSWHYHWYDPAGPVKPPALSDLLAEMAVCALRA